MKTPQNPTTPNRRHFMKSMLAAGMAPMFIPAKVLGEQAPSKILTLGFIGTGGHGTNYNLRNFLQQSDCRALSVCDVFKYKREAAATVVNEHYGNQDCRLEEDFRAVIEDPSLDGVVISTPDHWHVPMSVMGLDAGKHVFSEKPTLCIAEGRELIDAADRSGKVFQTGLEDRSLIHYHRIIELLRNGLIGDLYHVEVVMPQGQIHPAEPGIPVPDGLNWELWLGPAPYHEYTRTRTGGMHWRYIRDYATGILIDWGTHLVDTAQLAANDPHECATEVKAWGQPVPPNSQSDIPAIYEAHYRYSNGVTMHVHNSFDAEWLGEKSDITLQGSKGWVAVKGWRGQLQASDPKILRTRFAEGESRFWPRPVGEHRDFLDCIRNGQPTTYTAETLHKLCITLHMGLISMDLGRTLKFDPQSERFLDDEQANQRLHRTSRTDWMRA